MKTPPSLPDPVQHSASSGPLSGITVIEIGQVIAGPFAGAILADLGAEVIKIERPDGGDDARQMGAAFRNGDALNFHIFNRGKKSVTLDLKSPEGLAALNRVAAGADVLLHNLRPDTPEKMGWNGAQMCALHPQLVYCEISAFGHTGPMRLEPGYEPLMQAFSGLSSTNGGPDDPPMRAGASICDQGSGMWAVIGILAMLQRRASTQRGGVVNTSLLETALVWNAQKADAWVNQGALPQRHRSGHPGFVPYEAFDTADGPLVICCGNDRLFAKLAMALGRAQWVTDPRYRTNRERLAHKAALLAELAPLMAERTRAQWTDVFKAAGVPCAPVNRIDQALADPQVIATGILQAVPGEDFALTGLAMSIDGVRPAIAGAAPQLGQHNAEFGID